MLFMQQGVDVFFVVYCKRCDVSKGIIRGLGVGAK